MVRSGNKGTWLLALLFFLSVWNPTIAMAAIKKTGPDSEHSIQRKIAVMRILSVIEKKTNDPKLLEKAREKLFTVQDSRFVLITSLSEQMEREGDKPGVDIAFLLIAALIILS